MSNMSYCRFENTVRDIRDCLKELEAMTDHINKDDWDPEAELSSRNEQEAFNYFLQLGDVIARKAAAYEDARAEWGLD